MYAIDITFNHYKFHHDIDFAARTFPELTWASESVSVQVPENQSEEIKNTETEINMSIFTVITRSVDVQRIGAFLSLKIPGCFDCPALAR